MSKLSEIADSIKRHMSGETDCASVAKDAIQDGVGKSDHSQNGEPDNDNKQGESAVSKKDDSHCASCKKEWESLRSKGTPIECSFCRDWHCMNCADMRKSELPVVARDDMFWACKTCKPQIPTLFAQAQRQSNLTTQNENIHETLTESLNAIENRLEAKLDAKLEATVKAIQESIQPIQQKVSETVENSVSVNMSKAWSETLFGEQSESFPAIGDPRHKDAPIKPKLTLKEAIKEVATEQKKEDPGMLTRMNIQAAPGFSHLYEEISLV